jgi:ABC-type transporter Mla MlaB component
MASEPVRNQLSQEADRLQVSGPLTLETVPSLYAALQNLSPPVRRVDLQKVERVDSSALAWLLALCPLAGGGSPTFENPPENLRTLARLYELDFLRFSPSEPAS